MRCLDIMLKIKICNFDNKNKDQPYACILMWQLGNLQDSQKVFDIYTGGILIRITIKEFTMSERVVRHMHDWEKYSENKEYEKAPILKHN